MELLLAAHPPECGSCEKYLNCELQSLKQYLGVEESRVKRRAKLLPVDSRNPLFVHDPNKCVLCGRCLRACWDLRGVRVLGLVKQQAQASGGIQYEKPATPNVLAEVSVAPIKQNRLVLSLADAGCRFCGACVEVCPTGAMQDKFGVLTGAERKAAIVPCKIKCPAEIDVPRYVRFVARGDLASALAVIREKVPFPLTLGHVCDRPCESACRRGELNQAIAIRELKRVAAILGAEGGCRGDLAPRNESGKRVAVVGAGPAGLTAAFYLRLQGHQVTVFEALPEPGGMLRYGIPAYRLPREVLAQEIAALLAGGVFLKTNSRVESVTELLTCGYDGVVVAVGAHRGQRLRIPGATAVGVFTGVDFLRQVNSAATVPIADSVVVIGGGNVALDCARSARRLGASRVTVACLECRNDMPAAPEEIEEGEAEGVVLLPSLTPTRIQVDSGRVTAVEFVGVASFCFDDAGQAQVETVRDSARAVTAGTVIFATGQLPEWPEEFGLEVSDRGLAVVDPHTLATCREGVFVAGDAVTGTSSVIQAIASGKRAAAALDRHLGGNGRLDRRLAPVVEPEPCLGPGEGFHALPRLDQDLDEHSGASEASRCLQCDLRLKIKTVALWGEY